MKISSTRNLVSSCIAACMLALIPSIARGQWLPVNGPFGADVLCLYQNGAMLIAGTDFGGVYRSTDNGETWTPPTMGLRRLSRVREVGAIGANLFAASNEGVFISTDNGATWVATALAGDVSAFIVSGANLFATAGVELYQSTDNGTTWVAISSLPDGVTALFASGTNLYAGVSKDGAYRSTDNGATWTASTSGMPAVNVHTFYASGSNLFAGTPLGIYRSTDNGATWTHAGAGAKDSTEVRAFTQVGASLFAGTMGRGVIVSTDNGTSWGEIGNAQSGRYITALFVNGTNLFAGASGPGDGVYLSTNNGAEWARKNNGLLGIFISALAEEGGKLYASTTGGMFRSTDDGATWASISNGLPNEPMGAVAISGTDMFVGSSPYTGGESDGGVYHSNDNGVTWAETSLAGGDIVTLTMSGTTLFAGADGIGIHRSTDKGVSWTPVNSGLTSEQVNTLVSSGTTLLAGTKQGINRSTDNGASWSSGGLLSRSISSLAIKGTDLFAGSFGSGVFRSTDNGGYWSLANTGLIGFTSRFIYDIAASGANLFVATGDGIYRSTDDGANWAAINEGFMGAENAGFGSLLVYGSNLYAGGGLYAGEPGLWKRPLADFAGSSVTIIDTDSLTISVSPNPTNGIITLHGVPGGTRVEVMNVLGERVIGLSCSVGSDHNIDLTQLPAGAYFIHIAGVDVSTTTMIVRE